MCNRNCALHVGAHTGSETERRGGLGGHVGKACLPEGSFLEKLTPRFEISSCGLAGFMVDV